MTIRPLTLDHANIVAVLHGNQAGCLRAAAQAVADGADVLELRADLCSEDPAAILPELRAATDLPLLLTIRHAREGGKFAGDEAARLDLYQKLAPLVDAVDVELRSGSILGDIVKLARTNKLRCIGSYHDFNSTLLPSEFQRLLDEAQTAGCHVLKAAVTIQRLKQFDVFFRQLHHGRQHMPTAMMSMGPMGIYARMLAPLLGACLVYGYVGDAPTVPGQLPVRDLRDWLDAERGREWTIARALDVLGVAGYFGEITSIRLRKASEALPRNLKPT